MSAQPVNSPLTPNRTPEPGPTTRSTRRTQGRRSPVENLDYAAFAARIIRAHGRRIAEGDIEALPDLLDLADELDAATRHAVNGLRDFGYSWTDIATRLGTTRQAAQQRWGR